MPELLIPLPELLQDAAREALEEMFFMVVLATEDHAEPEAGAVCARVNFAGDASGSLALGLSPSAAAEVAANFLGQDPCDLSEEQIRAVVSEMANIVCGSALSHWKHDGLFVLAAPEIDRSFQYPGTVARCALELEQGFLWLSLALDEAVLAGG